MRKKLLDKGNACHISTRSYLFFIVSAFISTNKNMVVPRHYIASFNMYIGGRSNHFFRRHLSDNVFNSLKFSLSIGQDIRFDKNIFNHKTNIASEYLVAIGNNFRAIYFYIVFFKYCTKSIHFGYHILFYRIGTCFDVLCRLRVVGFFEFRSRSIAGSRT